MFYDPLTNPALALVSERGKRASRESVAVTLARRPGALIDFETMKEQWMEGDGNPSFAMGVSALPVIHGEGYQFPLVAQPLHHLVQPLDSLEVLPLGPAAAGEPFSLAPNASPSEPMNLAQLRRRRDPLLLGITPTPEKDEVFMFVEDRRFMMTPTTVVDVTNRTEADIITERLTGAGDAPVDPATWQPESAPLHPSGTIADPTIPKNSMGIHVVPNISKEVRKDPSTAPVAKRLEQATESVKEKLQKRNRQEKQ